MGDHEFDEPDDRPTVRQLLRQDTWWYPQYRDPVPIASMDKPWRYNTWQFLLRRADELAALEVLHLTFDAGVQRASGYSDVGHALEQEVRAATDDPIHWLCGQPLVKALRKGLPTGGRALRLLQARAVHWHTCPLRKKYPPARARCACIREGGRTVGATNDPETVIR